MTSTNIQGVEQFNELIAKVRQSPRFKKQLIGSAITGQRYLTSQDAELTKAIMSIAVDFLKKPDQAPDYALQIYLLREKIAGLQTQIFLIREELDQIIREIRNLEESFQQLPADIMVKEMRALQDQVGSYFPHWVKEKTEGVTTGATTAYFALDKVNRQLMAESYDYVYELTISFAYQMSLGYLIESDYSLLPNILKTVEQYLTDAQNKDNPNSYLSKYLRHKSLIDKIISWDAALTREILWKIEDSGTLEETATTVLICKYESYYVITGDVKKGFEVVPEIRNVKECKGLVKGPNYDTRKMWQSDRPDYPGVKTFALTIPEMEMLSNGGMVNFREMSDNFLDFYHYHDFVERAPNVLKEVERFNSALHAFI